MINNFHSRQNITSLNKIIFSHFNMYFKMPKFSKGSPEAIQFMKDLRAKRGTKTSTNKTVKKEHIKEIVSEALEKYYMSGTPVVEYVSGC